MPTDAGRFTAVPGGKRAKAAIPTPCIGAGKVDYLLYTDSCPNQERQFFIITRLSRPWMCAHGSSPAERPLLIREAGFLEDGSEQVSELSRGS